MASRPSPSLRLLTLLQFVLIFLHQTVLTVEGDSRFVLELTADSVAPAIEKFDVIMVEFYATWCGHCQHLAPEYDRAAAILAREAPHVKLAKIDADKYRSLLSKYDIGGYPTLRLYANGIPTEAEYNGRRTAEAIVEYVKSSLIPSVSTLSVESELTEFLNSVSKQLPIFIGFGLNTSVLEEIAQTYKRKAWFAVMPDFSEKVMMDFDFDKRPALVGSHPQFDEQSVFYGPFEGNDIGDFVQQHLLPLVSPVENTGTVKRLKEDGRPIAIGIVDSTSDDTSKSFIKKLKAAVPANRAFVFAYVEAAKWPAFVQPFGIEKASLLPTVVIWNRELKFSTSDDAEAFVGENVEAQLTRILHDYKENRLQLKNLVQISFFQWAKKAVFGVPALFVVCTLIILVFALQGCDWSSFTGSGDNADDHRDKGRRTDLEGEITADRIPGEDPLHVGRKSEKRD